MKCSKCKKNEATVYYKQNINGKVTESALCSECAKKFKDEYDIGGKLNGMFNNIFGGADELNLLGGLLGVHPQGRIAAAKVCPCCGATFKDFTKTGKAGCAECYNIFRDELGDTIMRIHSGNKHTGRAPKHFRAKIEKEEKITKLKKELDEAVKEQKFEDAARIRDEILSLSENKKVDGEKNNGVSD